MKSDKLHIVHLGVSGFPYGFGAMNRIALLFRGLQAAGAEVLIINRKPVHKPSPDKVLQLEGEYQGVPYAYTTRTPLRPEGFLKRTLTKISGILNEFKLIRKMRREGKMDAGLLYLSGGFGLLLYYRLISWLLGFPIIISHVEYRSGFDSRASLLIRINDWIYDHYFARFVDGVLPISEYLVDVVKKQAPKKPQLKMPVICDFERFDVTPEDVGPYFLYAGSANTDYHDLLDLVLNAYDAMEDPGEFDLKLILGGAGKTIPLVKEKLKVLKRADRVTLMTNIPHSEIPPNLANATALLIPMRDTVQDAARFPHKVGEYLASGTALIASNFGEIQYYFEDSENGYIAKESTEAGFMEKMEEVIKDPDRAVEIGKRGREMGLREFDYITHGKKLHAFISGILGRHIVGEGEPEPAKTQV